MRYKLLLTTVTILLMLTESFAQTYNMPASGSAEITSCTGTVYDPGGTGNYLDNTNSVLTIRPSDTTAFVFLSFSSFDLESGYDNLYIYDGTTTSAPLIATYTGYSAAAVYASNADGALTLRFSTDYSVTYSGFIATLSCIDSIPMADLFFESAFVNASSVNAGSSLSISSTVGNSSIISSYSTSMAYYLSDDMVLDGSDIQLSSSTLPAITGGNSTTITTSVTIPAATSQGAYYILFFADNIQGVTESNEANNIAAAQIMIVGAIADLSPRSFVLSPELTVRGSTISITASILNYGNVQSSTSFAGIYYSSDSLLDSGDSLLSEAAVSAISAGGYATLVTSAPLPDTLSAGEHYLLLRADNHDTIQESDETNNVLAARFAINEGLPDLTISSATPSVNSIAPGESLTISYVISNIGISNAFSSNSAVYLSSDTLWDLMDIFLGSESGTAISPTFTLTKNVMATIPGGLGSGTYYLLVYADYFNEVIEAREDNNIYHTPIVIPDAFTDLRLDAPAATVHYILAGGSATASCTVYNNGNTLCPSGSVGFYLSIDAGFDGTDVFLNSGNFATLAVGTSAVASASITIPPGTLNAEYYLLYFADYADAIAEDDETNNVSVIPITVSNAGSDLAATTPTLGNSAASPGGSVNATCYVRNYGNQNASYSYTGFYLSNDSIYQPTDTLLSSVYTGTLAAGASSYRSTTINIPSNTTYGDYYVLYFADRSELVNELNEDNNVCALPISIMAPSPDLIITTPTLSSNSVAPGQGLSAYCYIKNQGSATAASSYIGYYLSTDTIYSVSDTYLGYYAGSSLIAGSSSYRTKSLTVPGGTVPGTYYLLFFADYSTSVSEENETNNVSWCQLDVPVAFEDLTIQNASISDPYTISGSSLVLSSSLVNLGNKSSTGITIAYYFSTDTIIDGSDQTLGTTYISSIAANYSTITNKSITIPSSLSPGIYYILFFADSFDNVNETREDNNIVCLPIYITVPTIDIYAQTAYLSSYFVATGSSVSMYTYLQNIGTATAASCRLGYYLSADTIWDSGDTLLSSAYSSSIAGGGYYNATRTITIPSTITPGTWYLFMYADDLHAITESSEANNLIYKTVNLIENGSDLHMMNTSLSASTVFAGNSLYAYGTIRNGGNSSATSSNVGYYLSHDAIYDAGDVYLGNYLGSSLNAFATSTRNKTLTIPGGTLVGQYYLLQFADYSLVVDELDETNNVAADLIYVDQPSIDLMILSPTATPTSTSPGSIVSASCYIYNAGSSPSTSSNVGFYLSANQTWDAGDVYLGYAAGGTLNGSSQATRSGNIAIPGGTASGTWYILYFADYGETVDETDETNNVAFQTISVSTPYIDLTIATPQTTSATIAPGSSVTAYCYIANSGNTSASSSYVGYYLSIDTIFDGSDVYLSASTGGALAAGSQAYRSATITIPVSTTLGAYYVLFFADYQYYVSESIETNNVAWYAISVSNPAPDLTITTGSTSASTVLAGNSITGYATIQNIGSLSASSSQVGYYLSTDASWDNGDVLLTTSGGGTLNAGAQTYKNATLAIPGTTAGGNYYILFFADYAYLVTESNENNNVFAYPITVTAPGIDLIISGGSATPSSTVSGAIVAVSSTIQNIGTTAATYSYVGFYLSTDNIWDGGDQLLATVAGTNLASGASAVRSSNVTIPGSTAAGNYYILCYADNSNYVTETNEANNIYAISLAILPQYPDLLISSATIFPDTLEPGEQTALNYTISNAGYASASTSYTAYYISADTIWDQYDTYLTYYAGGSIIAGGTLSKSENLTIPTSISSGNYYILVYTDFIGYVNESNESNNVRAIPLTIEQLLSPDLMISSSALTSSTVDAGGSLNAMCYVKNQGTAASSQSMLAVYLSSDSLWTVQDNILGYAQTDALLPLEMTLVSQDIAIPLSVPDGDYFIIFKADFQNAISESNEYNNTAVKPLHVNNAGSTVDFSIETPTATPSPVAAGQKLYLSHVLKNNGTMTASIVRTGYYISDNATLEVGDDLLGSKATTGLAGGSSVTISDSVTIPSGMTGGTKYLIFAADYDYAFSETDENNNLASIQTEITGIQPDLEIVASSASTTQITAGDAINFSFTVKNSGDATSTVGSAGVYLSYDQTFQLSDQLLSSFALQQLAAGASQMLSGNLTIPQTVAGGDYYLIFFADDEESISEISEYNNTSSLMISVAAYGDEMIVPVAGSLAYTVCSGVIYDNGINNDYQASSNGYTTLYPGVTGNKIRITFTEFTTDLCCDILYIYNGPTTTSPLIGAYLTNPGAIEATNIDGALTLKFVSDASNQTSGFAAEVECASPGQNADLGISNLYMLSNVATADEYYPITSRIINSGGLDAQAFTVGYFLSSDSIFDISDVLLSESNSSGILQGQVEMHDYDLWLPPSLNAGDYYLIVYADMNDVVPENIETNNVKTVAITVLPATEGFAESSNTDSFIVFPNPAIGEVFVKLLSDNQKETSIILFNSLGQTVQKCTFEDSEILRIPLPAPGMYLLEIRQGNNRTVKKIIAE